MVKIKRFEIFFVELDPTIGSETKKTRPCVIISPDDINIYLNTVIIAPLTSSLRPYPTRVDIIFQKRKGQIVLDQIRTVDKQRLQKKIGNLSINDSEKICNILGEIFIY